MAETAQGSVVRRVLIIDDDDSVRRLCETIVTSAGLEAYQAAEGVEAAEKLASVRPDFVLLDVNLPGRNGMDLLREIQLRFPNTRVIMITGYATVDLAVQAIKLGAYDYIPKPFTATRLREVLRLPSSPSAPPEPAAAPRRSFCGMMGVSRAMHETYALIEKAARSDSTVLIEGESGTGKELAARAIHALSERADAPFVPVDCGAIPANLIESELFGHVAGAYTDAKTSCDGLLRAAGNGSVFLDEIGELPTVVQVKLLRALQEAEVRPVGSAASVPFRARVIAATNRDLSREVARGSFRRDLFYRLHVVPIFLPPLRERREDIPILVEHFLEVNARRRHRTLTITPEALRHFMRHEWPGNVRELENTIQRAFALLDGNAIEISDMAVLFPRTIGDGPSAATEPVPAPAAGARGNLIVQQEAETIRMVLDQCNGNKREAARILGIGIATLYRKIKKHAIVCSAR